MLTKTCSDVFPSCSSFAYVQFGLHVQVAKDINAVKEGIDVYQVGQA